MNLLDKRSPNELAAERELMRLCVKGDRHAFATLYSHYATLLYKAVYPLTNRSKEDTEEIIQELFVKIWDRRDNLLTNIPMLIWSMLVQNSGTGPPGA